MGIMFIAVYECGHYSKWRDKNSAPQPREHVICNYCTAHTVVVELVGPWRVKCHDCRRLNGHAVFEASVMRKAIAHAQEWTTHRVWVWRYEVVGSRKLVSAAEVGTQPPLFTDAPF